MQLPIFVVAALCILSAAVQAKPSNQCIGKAANIMFVLDSSSSIWIVDYKRQLKFVEKIVDTFNIGNGKSHVRIGAITFSNRAHLEFSPDRYTDSEQLRKAIRNIPYRTGYTNTADALKLLKTELVPRIDNSNGQLVAVVITDGRSRDTKATRKEAEQLHKMGVYVYAIGVGQNYDMAELKAIATDPDNGVYGVDSYSALEKISTNFYIQPCEDETTTTTTTTTTTAKPTTTTTTTPTPTTTTTTSTTPKPTTTTTTTTTPTPTTTTTTPKPTTSTTTTTTTPTPTTTTTTTTTPKPTTATTTRKPKPTTPVPIKVTTERIYRPVKTQPERPQSDQRSIIIFGYDMMSMGGYRSQMISQFVNSMLPYMGYGQYSVVSYAYCPESFNIPLSSLMNKSNFAVSHSVQLNKLPNLVDVVRDMRNTMYTQAIRQVNYGSRTAVLFVDPSVTTITHDLLKETKKIKEQGSRLFLVNVGQAAWPQPPMLYSMSSQPYNNYMFNIPTYDQLMFQAQHTPFKFRSMCDSYIPRQKKARTFRSRPLR